MQAKSRLKPEIKKELLKKITNFDDVSLPKRYLKHLPLLILSIPFFILIYYILHNVYPQDLGNTPINNSYLGLLIPFFVANSLLFSYLFLNTRRGSSASLFITVLLFLKLQNFIFEYWWFISIVIVFVIYEKIADKITDKKRA